MGHEPVIYFQLIGYLDWWRDHTRGNGGGNGHGKGRQQAMTLVGKEHGELIKANVTQVSTKEQAQTLQSHIQIESMPMALVMSNGRYFWIF